MGLYLNPSNEKFKEKLKQIYKHNYNKIFGRNDVITLLSCSTQPASYYLKFLYQNNIIISVNGYGKGKYKFSLK